MLVSYKWLSEYLDLSKISAKELSDQMSLTGIEVEGVEVPEEGLKKLSWVKSKNVYLIQIQIIYRSVKLTSVKKNCRKSFVVHQMSKRALK